MRRRTLLAAAGAALTLGACTKHQTRPAADLIAADPLGPLYTGTRSLIATYDQAMTTTPALVSTAAPLREEHRQHLIALAALIGIAAPPVAAGPTTGPSNPALSTTAPASTVPSITPPSTAPSTTAPSGAAPGSTGSATTAPASTVPGASGPGDVGPAPGGPDPSVSPTDPGDVIAVRVALSNAEKSAQLDAATACLAADRDRVAVLASIAASRAAHVAVLR